MKMKQVRIILLVNALLPALFASAQKDTIRNKSVDITSAFRPELKASAKINFNATPPTADTSKPRLQYDIPNPNLLFAYQPGSLKPLALQIDSIGKFTNSNYIKAGFGSLRTPYVQGGFSFGDGTNAGLNIYAKHVSSQGKEDFKDFSSTDVSLKGYYKAAQNMEWNASLGMKQDKTYKYGYEPKPQSFPNDSIRVSFQTLSARLNMHNINQTEFGLDYSPTLTLNFFNDKLKNNESNAVLDLPLQKNFGDEVSINLGVTFDLTRLSPNDKNIEKINNNMWYISPAVLYHTSTLRLQGGIRPSWDNGEFKMFPNILAEVGTEDQRFTFQAGWTGYLKKTSYQSLAGQNPWLWLPSELRNAWVEERYAGFKGSLSDHFTYSAKVAFNKLNNQPLFINDTSAAGDGKSFNVVYADRVNVLNLGGELGYNVEEKFSVITSLQFNQYTGIRGQQKAWGMLPMEFNTSMRYQLLKDLWLKGDLFTWSGARYLKKDGTDGKLGGAFDLNAGLEFKITKNLNLWTQFNNIFNKQYQRWNQYMGYGFNFVGGIIYSFDQKN
ncbi:MAG: hypothetical protein DI535_12790 [Citrobacter freundii]|nr:MAG: hypothetical protein DI535_12790 [Citrobacter freundii]